MSSQPPPPDPRTRADGPSPAPPAPDGPPPPPFQRRRRRWLLGVLAAVAVLVVVVPAGYAIDTLLDLGRDVDLTSDGGDATTGRDPAAPGPEVEVEVPDLEGLEGTDAAAAELLVDVDRAERRMMAVQDDLAAAFAEAEGGDAGDGEAVAEALSAAISDAAGAGQRDLQELRTELAAPVDDPALRGLRDRYLAHLDAWVRYLVALEEQPTLLGGGPEAEALTLSIDTTGDAFARSVEQDLPADLDPEVRAFAEAIVERGFRSDAPLDGDTV